MVTLSIPTWLFWGVVLAAALTLGLLAFASFVALAITGLTGGWLGGSEPWKQYKGTFLAFILLGLPVGLTTSYTWANVNPWAGIAAGGAVVVALGTLMCYASNRRRH